MVKIVEQVGEQRDAEKEALTLAGKPEMLNDTYLGMPESRTALMLFAAVEAWPTDKSGGRESEKSKVRLESVIPVLSATSVCVKATLEI